MFTKHNIEIIAAIVYIIIEFIVRITLIIHVPRNRKPSAAMAWLLAIFFLPSLLGLALFALIGSTKLSKERRERQDQIDALIDLSTANQSYNIEFEPGDRYSPFIDLNRNLGRLPASNGNHLTILPDYQATFDSLVKDIDKATQYIYIEIFILSLDKTTEPMFDALDRAAMRGVNIHILYDAVGSHKYKHHKEMKRRLNSMGVNWRAMLPISLIPRKYNRPDLRNHRKLIAIDNNVGYIGSLNLVEPRYERKDDIIYEELVSRMQGPVVQQAAAIVAGDWFSETGEVILHFQYVSLKPTKYNEIVQLLPSGPAYSNSNNVKLFVALLYAAEKKIVITNPYLVPDEALLTAIVSACQRGIEVIVINSAAIDQWMVGHAQRSYYQELLEAGVKIYLHNKPTLLHAKHITIDDDIAVIGSSNMDRRSFELDLECILVAYDKTVVKKLVAVQKVNLAASKPLRLKEWKKRKMFPSLLDSVARLASALQ